MNTNRPTEVTKVQVDKFSEREYNRWRIMGLLEANPSSWFSSYEIADHIGMEWFDVVVALTELVDSRFVQAQTFHDYTRRYRAR